MFAAAWWFDQIPRREFIDIDIGKAVFHLVGLNLRGEVAGRKKFSRTQLLHFTGADLHRALLGRAVKVRLAYLGHDTALPRRTKPSGYRWSLAV